MKFELNGIDLIITPETGDPWKEPKRATGISHHPTAGELVNCGTIRVGRKRRTLRIKTSDKPELKRLVIEWQAAKEAKLQRERDVEAAELAGLKDGSIPIVCKLYDGEYLWGHTLHGQAANLLLEIGAAKMISGWGTHVDPDLVKALGDSFTYPQAVEFTRPAREAEESRKAAKAAKLETIRERAATTGERQKIRSWITAECRNGNDSECSFDAAAEWMLPNGSRKTTYTCCF